MPIFFYWSRCTIRFWNSLLSSNNPLLEEIVWADLLLANRSDTWTYQVLHALQDLLTSQQFLDAIRSRQTINLGQFELTLREHIIGGWRDLDILTPHEAHHSSRIMRTYHTHFVYLWGILLDGGMTEKKSKACVASLPSLGHSQQPQPCTFLPSPFWPQLSSPKNAS